jgi:hypothetical protein
MGIIHQDTEEDEGEEFSGKRRKEQKSGTSNIQRRNQMGARGLAAENAKREVLIGWTRSGTEDGGRRNMKICGLCWFVKIISEAEFKKTCDCGWGGC